MLGFATGYSPDLMPSGRPHPETDLATRWLWLAFTLITLWRLGAAWLLPVTQDEAY